MALTMRQFKLLCLAKRRTPRAPKRSLELFHGLSDLRREGALRDTHDTVAIHAAMHTLQNREVWFDSITFASRIS
jgi:hypothetical protein